MRKHFPVKSNSFELKPRNEFPVRDSIIARCRVNADDPERTEITLVLFPVPISVFPCLPLCVFGRSYGAFSFSKIP